MTALELLLAVAVPTVISLAGGALRSWAFVPEPPRREPRPLVLVAFIVSLTLTLAGAGIYAFLILDLGAPSWTE